MLFFYGALGENRSKACFHWKADPGAEDRDIH